MNRILIGADNVFHSFENDEEGAQVVEYAQIIAVVSIALLIAIQSLGGGSFATFIVRVTTCLIRPAACI